MSLLARTKAAALASIYLLCGSVSAWADDSSQTKVSSADTQNFVTTAFQKGKEHYDSGRYSEALKEWELIDPYLDENPSVKKVVVFLRKQIQKKGIATPQVRVSNAAPPAPRPTASEEPEVQQTLVTTPITPEPVSEPLRSATQKTIGEASQAIAAKTESLKQSGASTSSAAAEQEKFVQDTFGRGKAAYEGGKFDEAVREWQKLSSVPGFAEPIRQLKENFAEYERQNAQVRASAPASGIPAELTSFLDKAGKRFEAEAAQLSSRANDTKIQSTREQETLKNIFDKANLLYAQSKYNQAIEEWKRALPIVGENSEIGRQIRQLETNYQEMLRSKQAYDETASSSAAASSSEEYTAELAKVGGELAEKARDAKQRLVQTETSASERRKLVADSFEKGRRAYDEGRTEEALAYWDKFSTDPQFRDAVQKVKASYDELSRTNAAYKSASIQEAGLSSEITQFLSKADQRFQSESSEVSARTNDMRERLSKNQQLVTTIFQQARTLYYQGKYVQAIEEWRRLIPVVGPDSEIARAISQLEAQYQDMRAAKQAAEEVERAQSLSSVSSEYAAELSKANQELTNKAREAKEKRAEAQALAKQRNEIANAAFQKGRALYDEGRVEEAVREWEKLGDDPNFESIIASIRQNSRELAKASTKLDSVSADQEESLKLMTDFLSKTSERLAAQASSTQARYRDEQAKLEKSQGVLQNSFEKGKLLYYQGKYSEALDAWKAVLSYVSPESEIAQQLASLESHHREMQQAKLASDQIAKSKQSSSQVSPEFMAELTKADQELAAKAEELKKKRVETELSLKQRQEFVDSTFQKGKTLYDQGRFEDAVKEWEKLSGEPEFQNTINSLKVSMRDREDANAALKSIAMDQVGLSQPLLDFFKKAGQRFQAEAEETSKRLEADRVKLSKTDQIVNDAFQQGKLLYFQGKYAQAVDEWAAILPVVGENSEIGRQITELEAAYQRLLSSKQDADEYQRKQAGGYKMPEELAKELASMNSALEAKAQESKKQRADLEASFKQKELAVDAAFQKGKALFNQGRYDEAVAKWEGIRQIAPVSSQFDALLTNTNDILKIKNENEKALSSQASQLRVPVSELETMLAKANQNLKAQTDADKIKALQERDQKQARVNAIFEQGRTYYDAGEYDRAASEWEKLIQFSDKNSDLSSALADFKKRTEETASARRSLAEASQSKPKLDPQTIEALSRMMQEAGADAARQAADVKKQSDDAVRVLSERQQWINNAFASGKKLYSEGKYNEAMAEWDKITVYIEDPQAKLQLTKFRDSLKASLLAKKQAMEAASIETAALETPSELVPFLSQAEASLKAQTQEALAERTRAEASVADRQAQMQNAFEKGRTFFTQRKYEEASREWNSLIPLLQDKAIADQIRALSASMAEASNSRAQARQSQIRLEAKFPAPQELPQLLTQAKQALSVQAQEAGLAKSKAEQSLVERQQWIQATTDKVKLLLSQKQYEEAANQIKSLEPYLDDKALGAEIAGLVKQIETVRAARADAETATKRAESKFASPKELPQLLSQARDALKLKSQEAAVTRSKAESTIAERREWIETTFNKGKTLFNNKQYEEAAGVFASLAPFLDARDPAASAIRELQASVDELSKTNAGMKESLARQNEKFAAPAELSPLLVKFSQDLKPQIEEARLARSKTEAAIAERQRWITATFEKGREFYKLGKFGEGIEEWNKLVPYLDEKSGIREQIGILKQAYEDLLSARRDAVQAAAHEYKSLELPAQFTGAFDEAVASLKKESLSTLDQKKQSEAAAESRRQEFAGLFQKGQELFSKGNMEEAVKTWDGLSAYLDEKSPARQSLQNLKSAYAELVARQSELKAAVTKQSQRYVASAAEIKMLSDASQLFATQSKDSQMQKTKADQVLSERKKTLETSFQSAQTLFNEGKIEQAVELWNALLPQLDPTSSAAKLITDIKAASERAQVARKELTESMARQNMKLTFSKEKADYLSGAHNDMLVKTKDSQAQKAKADQVLSERQKYLEVTFQKAQTLFNEGKTDQAVELWSTLSPQLDPASDAAKLIEEIKATFAQTQASRKELASAVARQEQKHSLPAEQVKFLSEANQDLVSRTQSAIAEKTKLEAELAEKEKWALEAYTRGKALYDKGQYAEAIAEWEKVVPFLGDSADEARRIIGSMNANFEQALKAKKATSEFALNQYNNIKAPYATEMTKLLQEGTERLQRETEEAKAQRADMEKSFNDRQAWIASTFAKGKELSAKGQHKEASDTWAALLPYLDQPDAVSSLLKSIEIEQANVLKAKRELEAAAAKKDEKLATPAELSQLLTHAAQTLKVETQGVLAEKGQLDQAAADRQKWIRDTFERGKSLYNRGQYDEAARIWESMLIYLEDGPAIKSGITQLDASYQQALAAKNILGQAAAKKDQKFPAPTELTKLLMQAAQDLKLQAQEAEGARSRAEQSVSERQAWLASTFTKGKELYDQGKYNQAITLWQGMTAYLEDSPQITELMEAVAKNYEDTERAKLETQQALVQQEVKLTTPEDLVTLLGRAAEDLREQTRSAKAKAVDLERSRIERKQWIDATFKDGKLYYDNAEYEKAAATWEPLIPYLSEERALRGLIQTLRENAGSVSAAKREAEEYRNKTDIRYDLPIDVAAMASDAIGRLNREVLEAQQQKSRAEQSLKERQQWVVSTFQEGKLYYDQKQYREALEQWEKLTPFVDEKTGFRQLVESVRQAHKESLEAKRGAVEAVANEYKGLKLAYADEMIMLLNEADTRLKAEAAEANQKRESLEKSLAERREWIVNTFNRGKISYDQGQFQEAVEQWDRLLPYLEPGSEMKRTIESIKDNYTTMNSSVQAVKESSSAQPVALDSATVAQATAVFREANEKFKSDAAQAQAQLAEIQQILTQRRSSFEQVFEKGRALYDQGKYNEAFIEWERLTPFLNQLPDLKQQVDEAKKNYNEQFATRQKVDEAKHQEGILKPLPILGTPSAAYNNAAASTAPVAVAELVKPQAQAPAMTSFEKPEEAAKETADQVTEETAEQASGLQFVSGEIASVDGKEKTIKLKLYSGTMKDLEVSFDASTQITGDEEGVASELLKAGAAVDVRFDPSTKKASYIYIYS